MTAPRIVGVDLSLTSTGMCWGAHGRTGTVGYSLPRTASEAEQLDRMRYIAVHVMGHAHPLRSPDQRADLVVLEDLIPGARGASGAQTVGLHYVVRHTLAANGVPYVLVHNTAVKMYATGKGSGPGSDKRGVALAVADRFGVRHATTDETDAWVLRAMACDHYGHPLAPMPKAHRRALDRVPWPELEEGAP